MADEVKENVSSIEIQIQYQYSPSLSTGIYGSYIYINNIHKRSKEKDGLLVSCDFKLQNEYNLYISYGSVVSASTEAIVNAADEYMLGGDGVDGAITLAGGDELDLYRRAVPFVDNDILKGIRCPTGQARITKTGGNLKCSKYVIHTVGPDYSKLLKFKTKTESKQDIFKKGDKLLYDCYMNTMKLAKEYKIKSIAFSLISCGIFKGQQSIETVLSITAQSIYDNLYQELETLHMVAFTGNELKMLQTILPKIWGQSQNVYQVEVDR